MNREKLLDKKTVIERYHFSKWQLEWLCRTRQIGGMVRVGKRRIFFDPEALERWIKMKRIDTANVETNNEE